MTTNIGVNGQIQNCVNFYTIIYIHIYTHMYTCSYIVVKKWSEHIDFIKKCMTNNFIYLNIK